MLHLLIALLATPAGATGALEAAEACYDALDYQCAEARLDEALSGELADAERERALVLQALVYVAYRDEGGARRAARALYALDPDFVPDEALPPTLRSIFAEVRPEEAPPAPPPRLSLRAHGNTLLLAGRDASRWSRGLGAELDGGLAWASGATLHLTLGISDHLPQQLVDEGMVVTYGGLGGGWRWPAGPVHLTGGLTVAMAHVSIDGAFADEAYWGGWLQIPLGVEYPVWGGLAVSARVSPGLFTTPDGGRLAGSWLLPISAGLSFISKP